MLTTKLYGAPGTGKTTTLLDILQKEIADGTPLKKIAFVTHTVAARDEAKSRARKIITNAGPVDFRYFKTIHGICFNAIGLEKAQVMQAEDYLAFGDRVRIPFSADFTDDLDQDGVPVGWMTAGGNEILAVRQFASAWQKDYREVKDQWPEWISPDLMHEVMAEYVKFKSETSKFDFVDMLEEYDRDGSPIDADVVIVDEAQDLSRLQWSVVARMAGGAKRIYLAGDDDQSIYGFIGADPTGFLHHRSNEEIVLPRTYRLKQSVYDFSQQIIKWVRERRDKHISVDGAGGSVEFWNVPVQYLDFNPDHRVMVIARHHKQLGGIAHDFTERGIAFTHRGRSLVGTARARAAYWYLHAKMGDAVPVKEAVKIIECCYPVRSPQVSRIRDNARSIPDATIDKSALSKEFRIDFDSSWVDALCRTDAERRANERIDNIRSQRGLEALISPPRIDLTTYHGSKGREAEHVVLFTDVYNSAYRNADRDPDDERRLSYVGVTRAIEKLTIVAPQTNMYMRTLV